MNNSVSDRELPDPLDNLEVEHQIVIRHALELRDATDLMKRSGFSSSAFEQVARSVQLLAQEVKEHGGWEERNLFPPIERHQIPFVFELRADHRELRSMCNGMMQGVRDIQEGRPRGTAISELLQAARSLVELLITHIAREKEILFPLVRKILTPAEYDQVRLAFADKEAHHSHQ